MVIVTAAYFYGHCHFPFSFGEQPIPPPAKVYESRPYMMRGFGSIVFESNLEV